MSGPASLAIMGAVEGDVDEAVLRRLIEHVGAAPGTIFGKKGKGFLQTRLRGYNRAARFDPWVVLVDLDQDEECAPLLRTLWLSTPEPKMCFRVAVQAVEAWILADRERVSRFMGVRMSRVPSRPESEPNPKATIVQLARQSRRRDIRQDMVPSVKSGRAVGPAYVSRLMEFVLDTQAGWRPEVAARSSESLRRCLRRLRTLAGSRSGQ